MKAGKGLDVAVEVTIAPGGSSLFYSITVSTTGTNKPLGIYDATLKLRN